MDDLKITVGADINNFLNNLGKANKSLGDFKDQAARFKDALDKSTDPASIIRLNRALEASAAKIKILSTVGSSSFKGVASNANTAGQSLQNLGRIAQDAPFGFIGIQNNLNPLIESFGRLQAESGSTGKALKSLVSGMIGPAGIGLAISVITGALTILAQKGFFTASKSADEYAEKLKKFTEIDKQAHNQIAKDIVDFQILARLAVDVAKPYEARKKAVDELQKTYPTYLGHLKDEDILNGNAALSINKVTEALYNKAYAEAASAKASQVLSKLLDLRAEENKLVTKRNELIAAVDPRTIKVYGEAAKSFPILDKQIGDIQAQFEGVNKEVNFFIEEGKKFKSISILGDPAKTAKAKKDIETISDVMKNVRHEIDDVNNKFAELFNVNKSKDNIQVLTGAIEHLFDKFSGKAGQQGAIIKLKAELDEIELKESLSGTVKGIKIEPVKLPLTIGAPAPSQLQSTMKNIKADFTKQLEEMTGLLRDSVANMAVGIGEALGKAFSGGGSFIKDALGSVFGIMGDFLIQLGKAAVMTSNLFLAIKASKTNPITGIVGGIAAIAAGYILKNIKLPEFASGGYVTGPGTSTSDSINARLSKGEYVIKAETVNKFGKSFFDMINGGGKPRNGGYAAGGSVNNTAIGGGQLITVEVIGNIKGNDIYIANRRTALKVGRNG